MARVQRRGRRSQGEARCLSPINLRPSVARALRRRRHRNERQDVVHALDSAMPRGLRPEERSPRHARQRAGRPRSMRRCARRPTRRRSTRPSPGCATPAPKPSRWKSRRTAWSRGASTPSSSTSRCSRISRAIISTITGRWRRTRQPRRGLFAWPTLEACVINADDPFGRTLADTARARGQRVLTYGLDNADIAATSVATTPAGLAAVDRRHPGAAATSRPACPARSTRRTCWVCWACCSRAASSSTRRSRRSRASRRRQDGCNAWVETACRWS